MKILGIIPARMASTRFPGKPLAMINGMPMIGHVYFRSKICPLFDDICIATCDQEIADYAVKIGVQAVMTSELHERASDRCTEALQYLEETTQQKFDIVVLIQGDEPMLVPQMLTDLVESLLHSETASVANLMAPISSKEDQLDPNEVKVVFDRNYHALYYSREPIPSLKKAASDIPMFKQLGLIAFRRDFLLQYGRLAPTPLEIAESVDMLRVLEYGYKVVMVPTEYTTISVDVPEELKKVELLMQDDQLVKDYAINIQGAS